MAQERKKKRFRVTFEYTFTADIYGDYTPNLTEERRVWKEDYCPAFFADAEVTNKKFKLEEIKEVK